MGIGMEIACFGFPGNGIRGERGGSAAIAPAKARRLYFRLLAID